MLLSYFLLPLLPLVVVASPATTKATTTSSSTTTTTTSTTTSAKTTPNLYSDFCSVQNAVITALKQTSTATAFCSSYLSIPTKTFSATSTITPAPKTVTTTTTAATSYTTVIVTTVTTTTVTNIITSSTSTSVTVTSTVVATCFSSAYSAPQKRDIGKRGGTSSVATPACIPTTWAASLVSSACSCLNIPTPSTTLTTTTTLVPVTFTNTATITPTGTVTNTYTSTVTATSISTTVTTTTSTTVVTATSAPVANGVTYRQYLDKEDANQYYPNFPVVELQSESPQSSGTQNSVNFQSYQSGSFYITFSDGNTFQADQAAVVMQAFFVAPETGTYTFETGADSTDNWNILWTGTAAYTWQDGAQAYEASRTGQSSSGFYGGSTQLNLNAGDAVPMTFLFANGGGPANSEYDFYTADGKYSGDPSQYLVQPCPGSPFQ